MARRDTLKLMNAATAAHPVASVHSKPDLLESVRTARVAGHAAEIAGAGGRAGSDPRSELSREVRIALDGLALRGLTVPRRAKHARSAGSAPFICG